MAVMALGLISQTAVEAGGGSGGSKKKNGAVKQNATVIVVNTQAAGNPDMAIIVFPISNPPTIGSMADFSKAGGKLVGPGKTVPLPTPPGDMIFFVGSKDLIAGPFTAYAFYSVAAGKTYTCRIGGDDEAPTIHVQ